MLHGPETRLRRVKRKHTGPERALVEALRTTGARHGIANDATLPGTPDLAFRRERLAVFVDGCFWHACPVHGVQPKSNANYWHAKLARNVARDRRKDAELFVAGWQVVRLWEHEIAENVSAAAERVAALLRASTRYRRIA